MGSGSGTRDDAKGDDEEVKLPVEQRFGQTPVTIGMGGEATLTDIATRFRCRICDKPPSVETQPAATFCGHLFCYK